MKHLFAILPFLALPLSAIAGEFAKIGQTLPDVLVQNVDGQDKRLRDLIAQQPSVLIFYRGGWCPFCNRHLAALAGIESELKAAGYQLLAISPDLPERLKETSAKKRLGYTLLSDSSANAAKGLGITFQLPDSTVSRYKNAYSIDLEAYSGQKHHLLPHPAVFIVDTQSTIRFAHINPDFKVRLNPQALLAAVRNLNPTTKLR